MFCSPRIVIYAYNNKQHDAFFTFNLFQLADLANNQST